jgi:hypothetical protein
MGTCHPCQWPKCLRLFSVKKEKRVEDHTGTRSNIEYSLWVVANWCKVQFAT